MQYESEIEVIRKRLDGCFCILVEALNSILADGIPEHADKIVIWVPLGPRYNLTFTYMTNDANEAGGSYPQTEVLDDFLGGLLDDVVELDADTLNDIAKATDREVASWLQRGMQASGFNHVQLQKVMAINNVCAYFDLETLKILEDGDMWG